MRDDGQTGAQAGAGGASVATDPTDTMSDRRKIGLALVVACALFMETLDSTALAPALPTIADEFGEPPLHLSLALSSYLVTLAVLIPASGWAADRFGPRRVFVAAVGFFVLGSVLCSLSWDLMSLVAARVVQGMGGAMMSPVGRFALLRVTRKDEMLRMMSWVTVPGLIGPVLGPGLGGFLTEFATWHWIFLLNVPIGLIGAVFAWRLIPAGAAPARPRLDRVGLLLAGLGCGGIVFGIDLLTTGIAREIGIALILAAAVSVTLYVRRARAQADPLIDLGLLRDRYFGFSIVAGFPFRLAMGAMPLLFPLLFQLGFGLDAFRSGLLTVCSTIGIIGMKAMAPFLIRRIGYRRLIIWNAVANALIFFAQAAFPVLPWAVIVLVLLAGGLARSLHFTAVNTLAFAEIPSAHLSRATSMSSMGMQMSNSLGIGLGSSMVALLTWHSGAETIGAAEVAPAFLLLGALTMLHAVWCLRLPADAGAALMARRSG